MAPYKMYIDGKFVNAKSGKTFDVYDPATEGVIATCPAGEARTMWTARPKPPRLPSTAAGRTPRPRSAAGFSSRSPTGSGPGVTELAKIETLNSGKPIVESEYDMDDCVTCFEYYGGLATKINGEVITCRPTPWSWR